MLCLLKHTWHGRKEEGGIVSQTLSVPVTTLRKSMCGKFLKSKIIYQAKKCITF